MMTDSLTYIRDILHAQFCYQLFITPLHFPLEKKYRDFGKLACEYIENRRSEIIHIEEPRHHVIHRFKPAAHLDKKKKILITHGWMSRAAYMVRYIRVLQRKGYDVYALDFPAHGDAKGVQLPWTDAVAIIRQTLNTHGPFYAVLGHSFGGSMLLSTLNLAGQLPEWQLEHNPERAILIASPTQMRTPMNSLARRFKLSAHGYLYLRQLIRQQTMLDPSLIRLSHYVAQMPNTPFLCVHGELDDTVHPKESMIFCREYKNAELKLLKDADHVTVLMDERVEQMVCEFLE